MTSMVRSYGVPILMVNTITDRGDIWYLMSFIARTMESYSWVVVATEGY